MKKTFLVVYEKGKKNYSGFAPDVPGCGSVGDTLDEMRANLREALELYMDASLEFGYALPEPVTSNVTLPIEGETDLSTTYVVEHLSIKMPRAKTPRTHINKASATKRREIQAA